MVRQAETVQEQQSTLNPPAAAVEDLREFCGGSRRRLSLKPTSQPVSFQ